MANPFFFDLRGQVERGQLASAAIQKKQREQEKEQGFFDRLAGVFSGRQGNFPPGSAVEVSPTEMAQNALSVATSPGRLAMNLGDATRSYQSFTTTPGLVSRVGEALGPGDSGGRTVAQGRLIRDEEGRVIGNEPEPIPPPEPTMIERASEYMPHNLLQRGGEAIAKEVAPAIKRFDAGRLMDTLRGGGEPTVVDVEGYGLDRVKGPQRTIQSTAETVKKATETLQAGGTPDADTLSEVMVTAERAQGSINGGKPMSEEAKAAAKAKTKKEVSGLPKNERIDLLVAGLSMLSNIGSGRPAAANIGRGLLAGVQAATAERAARAEAELERAAMSMEAEDVQSRRTTANASMIRALSDLQEAAREGGPEFDLSEGAIEGLSNSIAANMTGNDEELTPRLAPFVRTALDRELDAVGGDIQRINPERVMARTRQLADATGQNFRTEEDSFWGFLPWVEGEGQEVEERDDITAQMRQYLRIFQ